MTRPDNGTSAVARIVLAIPEQRRELDLSLRQVEEWTGVSLWKLRRIERGERFNPADVLRVAGVLNTLELAPKDEPPDPVVVEFKRDAEQAVDDFGRELDRWVVDSLGTAYRMRDGAA